MSKTLRLSDDLALPAEDWHWLAGIFEGEGTITIAVRNRDETYRIVVVLGNTDRQMVDWFHARFGGYLQGAYGLRPRRRPAWHWTLIGPRAERFIRGLRPYLRTERVQRKADLALAFRDLQRVTGHKGGSAVPPTYKPAQRKLYLEMKELNARGIAEGSAA